MLHVEGSEDARMLPASSLSLRKYCRQIHGNYWCRLGDDVDDSTNGAPKLHAQLELITRNSRTASWRRAWLLHARSGRNVVCAIDSDEVVVNILSSKGEFSDGAQ